MDRSEPRTRYGWLTIASLWVLLLLFTAIPWAAWLQQRQLTQWLVVGVVAPLVFGYLLIRLHLAELVVRPDGTLRARTVVTREVDLRSLTTVDLSPSVPYADMGQHGRPVPLGLVLTDATGRELTLYAQRNRTWRDPRAVVAVVADHVRRTGARCSPRAWEVLHEASGQPVPPYPSHLTEPPAEGWGVPVRRQGGSRAFVAISLGALVAFPLGFGLVTALSIVAEEPLGALTAVIGGAVVTVPCWLYLRAAHRRGDRAHVLIHEDGRAAQLDHVTGRLQLGLRLVERSVDLQQLRRVRFEPGTAPQHPTGNPGYWILWIEDAAGDELRLPLLHEYEPPALLFPQLCRFVEAGEVPLDLAAHRGLGLRLGRELTNPVLGS